MVLVITIVIIMMMHLFISGMPSILHSPSNSKKFSIFESSNPNTMVLIFELRVCSLNIYHLNLSNHTVFIDTSYCLRTQIIQGISLIESLQSTCRSRNVHDERALNADCKETYMKSMIEMQHVYSRCTQQQKSPEDGSEMTMNNGGNVGLCIGEIE